MTTNNDHNELEQGLLDSMKEFEGVLETDNDHAAALELWEAMGEAGMQPKNICDGAVDCDHHFCYDCDMGYGESGIDDTDALFILTGHAERWLQRPERWGQWDKSWACNGKGYYWDMGKVVKKGANCSLAAAIRAEMGMEE